MRAKMTEWRGMRDKKKKKKEIVKRGWKLINDLRQDRTLSKL